MPSIMKTSVRLIMSAIALASWATIALAAGEGTAVGVDPDAVARLSGADRVLQVGADVSVGERIVTGPSGQVQVVFDDETRLVVGPGSSLLIETYLLAGSNTAQKLTINALGGSFRFITGNSPKPAYSIKTPTATIAVRGTEFDLQVGSAGTSVLLYDGALRLCGKGSACVDLVDRCDLGSTAGGGPLRIDWSDAEHAPLARQFRYARFQTSLLTAFRVSGASQCAERRAAPGPAQSLGTQLSGTPDTFNTIPTPSPFNRQGN